MFEAQWLILWRIACFATAAAYQMNSTAPQSNTTIQAFISTSSPYSLSSTSTLSALSTTRLASSDTTQLPSSAVSTPLAETLNNVEHFSAVSSTPQEISSGNGSATFPITSNHESPQPTESTLSSQPFKGFSNSSNTALNASCTVNVPSANVEWWYLATYFSAAGTYVYLIPNGTDGPTGYMTLKTNTDTASFDMSSAMASSNVFVEITTTNSENSFTYIDYLPYSVKPAAATTSVVPRDYRVALPSGNMFPSTDLFMYLVSSPKDATVPIATSANFTSAMTSATPFLYFTAYEVESKTDGAIVTKTITLPQPTAIEYAIKDIENSATASGTLPASFLQQIPESACSPGTVQGAVTVLVVLDIVYVYKPHANPFIVHAESTAAGWEDDPSVESTSETLNRLFTAGPESSQGGSPGGNPPIQTPATRIPSSTPPRQTVGSIGSNPVLVGPSSVVIVGSSTLKPGAPPVTIGGSVFSVAPSATAIVINGHTSSLPIVANPGSPQTVGTVGGSPVVVGPSSVVVIGGQTLLPGGNPVFINGSPASLAPAGNAIIVGSTAANGLIVGASTSFLPQVIFPTGSPQAPPVLTIGSSTLTANAATQFFIAPGQTLTPGGTATINGQLVSLDPSASFVVIGGSTQLLPTSPGAIPQPEIVVDGTTITALPNSPNGASGPTFVISGQTLLPGDQITVSGTTISLAPSGSFIVINGATTPLTPTITDPPVLTLGSHTYTALPGAGTAFVIDGQTLTPGGVLTVNGTTISLAPGATALVYGSDGRSITEALFPATTTRGALRTAFASAVASASAGATGRAGEAAPTSKKAGAAAPARIAPVLTTVLALSLLSGFWLF